MAYCIYAWRGPTLQAEAIPLLSTDCTPDGYSMAMMSQCAQPACEQGIITEPERQDWLEELAQLGADDAYFFCVNRFLFLTDKH